MQESHSVRLYEDASRDAARHVGRYTPVGVAGWDVAVGDTFGLEDDFGQYVRGTVTEIDEQTRHDDDAAAFRIVTVTVED